MSGEQWAAIVAVWPLIAVVAVTTGVLIFVDWWANPCRGDDS